MSAPRFGFIGLGNIGLPMALRMAAAGLTPTVYDLRDAPVRDVVAAGGLAAASIAALAAACEVIGICVRDEADLETVLLAPDGLLASARPDTVVAVHSTVRRGAVIALGTQAEAARVELLDACVAGGSAGASAGTLAVMVGGNADAVARAHPMFESFAAAIVHTGGLGTGCAAKLCVQTMQYVAFAAAYEALELGRAAGLSDAAFNAAIEAAGVVAESHRRFFGLYRRPAEERTAPAFQTQLGAFVAIAEKDIDAVLALGDEHGIPLPTTAAVQSQMARVYGFGGARGRGK